MAISRNSLRIRRGFPMIQPGTARFPRRFAPRNDNSDSLAPPNHHCNTRSCLRRSQPARGTPHLYGGKAANGCEVSAATDAIGAYHFIGSVYESPLPTIIVSLVYSKITALPVHFRQRGSSCQKSPFGLFRQAAFRIAK